MAYTTYTVATLRTYIRALTGIFSTDIISDATLNAWINEVYSDLARQQEWSWSTNAAPAASLSSDSSSPAFDAQYHPLIAYKVAALTLGNQADDTPRAQQFMQQYQEIVAAFVQDDLQITSTADVINSSDYNDYSKLVIYVRKLLDVYDGTISNTLITNKLKDEYSQLFDSYTWSWTKTTSLLPIVDYARILAYGVASRLASELGKPELVEPLAAEAGTILLQMKRVLLYTTAVSTSNLGNIRKYTRALLGNFSKDLPDTVLNAWINEAYLTLQNEKDWVWLRQEYTVTVPSGTSTITLPAGATGKIMGVFIKPTSSISIQKSFQVPHIMDIDDSTYDYQYQVTPAGVLTISPSAKEQIEVRIRYVATGGQLTSDSDTPAFLAQFNGILAYKTAIKGFLFMPDSSKQILEIYSQQYSELYDSMVSYYQLDHNSESLQLGSKSLETRRYIPFFRVG